jgi:large subunit ribosomal protein L22
MEVRAVAKYVKAQPRKIRIVAQEIKGEPAIMSAHKLQFHPSKGARLLRKVLVSAIANAAENNQISADTLRVSRISIDEGPRQKRVSQRAQGRGNRILKKTSHITVVLEQYEPDAAVKPHGTKAKARPKFEAPKKKAAKKEEAAAPVEEVKEDVIEETAAETADATEAPEAPTADGSEESKV